MSFLVLKYVHVLGATVILGTGIGIAIFYAHGPQQWQSGHHRSHGQDRRHCRHSVHIIGCHSSTGDRLFPDALVRTVIWGGWIAVSLALYLLAGAFWGPVLWIQARMRDLASAAADAQEVLPAAYNRLFGIWFAFGFPAFGAVLVILALMTFQPVLYEWVVRRSRSRSVPV